MMEISNCLHRLAYGGDKFMRIAFFLMDILFIFIIVGVIYLSYMRGKEDAKKGGDKRGRVSKK